MAGLPAGESVRVHQRQKHVMFSALRKISLKRQIIDFMLVN
jgi:hypothetical protein